MISLGAVSYSRSPVGTETTSPVSISVAVDNFDETGCAGSNYWSLSVSGSLNQWYVFNGTYTDVYNGKGLASSTLSNVFVFNLPVGEEITSVMSSCGDNELGDFSSGGLDLEGNGTYVIFTLVRSSTAASTGSASPTESAAVGTVGQIVHTPFIELSLPSINEVFAGRREFDLTDSVKKFFRGTAAIVYKASDFDDESGNPEYGLKPAPFNIYYALPESRDWILLAENQTASGTILWDTSKLADGDGYALKATATGIDNDFGFMAIKGLSLDNTLPHFIVKARPNFSKGEPIKIEIESSEILGAVPFLTIAQFNREPAAVSLTGDVLGKKFSGQYKVVQGFDGPAKISIEGEDHAGNKGNFILGDDGFSVGIRPPLPPVVETPSDKTKTSDLILPLLSGKFSVNAKKIIVKINGRGAYVQEKKKDEHFRIKNIKLNPNFNKGRNVISVISEDPMGIVSEPVNLEILVNSPPKITLLEPVGRLLKLNGLVRFNWKASDINDDALTYQVELSDNQGQTWKVLSKNLKEPEFIWDSATVPDGSNYVIKAAASDGSLTAFASSNRISVINDQPAIILESSGYLFTAESSKIIKGIVRSKNDLLIKLDFSSDNGKTWRTILPEDGLWNSVFERFSFKIPSLKPGQQKIILRGAAVSGRVIINAQGLRVIFDNQAPTLTMETLPSRLINNRFPVVGGLARDDFSGIETVEYAINDSIWYRALIPSGLKTKEAMFKIVHPDGLADGQYQITARAIDRAGNISKTKTQSLTIDATPPRIGSFILETDGKVIFPDKKGVLKVLPQSPLRFRLAIAGQPKKVKLSANGGEVNLKFNSSVKLWEADFKFDNEELINLRIEAEDEWENKTEKDLAKISTFVAEGKPKPRNFREKVVNFFRKTK